ncbi:MAG: 2Fe-2S iron-sulfur cluster-binding protein [Lachnospiraceae bacterium]|nr:2Fe-2S iron-sulfur cluster-binding protein [Lachnospiraceae bacterium]
MKFELNGKKIDINVAADEPLLEVLRRCNCYSVRSGCDTSNCGICTVWVDDRPILSCSYPAARAEGKKVTTIEGVPAEAHEVMELLANEGADQCGYCSPGFIMSVIAMKRDLTNPTEQEINEYLAGNLCRCTGYMSQARVLEKLWS